MNTEWSDHEIEMLLRGRGPASGDLARLRPVIDSLRARTQGQPDTASVAAMAAVLADAVRHPSSDGIRKRSGASRPAAAWRRRAGYAAVAAILASVGVAGTAAAADGAAPGDLLYGIDRALEKVGIGNGGSHERLQEAEVLVDRGEVDAALHHAADAFRGQGDSATSALEDAAAALEANGSENSAEVHARVAEMLQWMSAADPKEENFGQQVSSRARQIGDKTDDPAANDTSAPGNSGNAGKPDEPGNSGSAGKPDSPGNSGNAGNHNKDKTNPSHPSEGPPADG
jgi:hypothetical protein